MRSILTSHHSRIGRCLALSALLFVIGLQVQETAHSHALDETVAQCLLCNSPVDAALPPSAPTVAAVSIFSLCFAAVVLLPECAAFFSYYSRGPPRNS